MGTVNLQHNVETRTDVPVSITAVTLAAANPNRRAFSIFNNSATAVLFVEIDNPATLGSAAFAVKPRETFFSGSLKTDALLSGIWDVADAAGKACVREYAE